MEEGFIKNLEEKIEKSDNSDSDAQADSKKKSCIEKSIKALKNPPKRARRIKRIKGKEKKILRKKREIIQKEVTKKNFQRKKTIKIKKRQRQNRIKKRRFTKKSKR